MTWTCSIVIWNYSPKNDCRPYENDKSQVWSVPESTCLLLSRMVKNSSLFLVQDLSHVVFHPAILSRAYFVHSVTWNAFTLFTLMTTALGNTTKIYIVILRSQSLVNALNDNKLIKDHQGLVTLVEPVLPVRGVARGLRPPHLGASDAIFFFCGHMLFRFNTIIKA